MSPAESRIVRVLRMMFMSAYLQNIATLISGTVLTQAIIFLFSPLLSRIFSLADFGNLANFNAWVAVLALVASLRYEHAIIIARGESGVGRVLALTAVLSFATASVLLLAAIAIRGMAVDGGYLRSIRPIVLYVPLGVFVACLSSPLIQLCVRTGKLRRVAGIAAAQVLCTVIPQIVLGVLGVSNGLIIGTIVGYACGGIYLFVILHRESAFRCVGAGLGIAKLKATAREFSDFPRYTLGADAITVVVQQFVPVFVLALFNPALAGVYSFAIRIVRVPLIVVATAFSTALRKEAADRIHEGRSLRRLYLVTVSGMCLLALGPFMAMLLYSRQIFVIAFGHKWEAAGRVVQILSPGILVEFIAFPLAVLFLVTNTQRYTFRIQLVGFIGLLTALAVGQHYFNDFITTCYIISAVMVAVNGASILLAARVTGGLAFRRREASAR